MYLNNLNNKFYRIVLNSDKFIYIAKFNDWFWDLPLNLACMSSMFLYFPYWSAIMIVDISTW